jgi:hypothetical protein
MVNNLIKIKTGYLVPEGKLVVLGRAGFKNKS